MAGPTLFRPDSISSGLVGYWKFDNDATDSSGSGYDLTPVNTPTYSTIDYWKTGEYSTDLEASSTQYFSISDQAPLDFAGSSFTWAFWAKPEGVGNMGIICKANWAPTDGFQLAYQSGAGFSTYINNQNYVGSSTDMVIGKWRHYAFVRDIASTNYTIFIDGNFSETFTCSETLAGNAEDLKIGYNAFGGFDGLLKDVACWSSALNPIQIKSLSLGVDLENEAYRPDDVSTAPTAWWKMNELSGDATDSSGNGHTGTDKNTVTSAGGYVEGVARKFDGSATAEYFEVATDSTFNLTGDFSWAFWWKPDTAGTKLHTFIAPEDNDTWMYFDYTFEHSRFDLSVYPNTVTVSKTGLSTDVWYHIGLTRSGSISSVYLDGSLVGTGSTPGSPSASSAILLCSNHNQQANQCVDGAMQDMAYWGGTCLSASTIAKLASAFPIQQTGVVSYWNCDEASGNLLDSIGSNTGVESSGTIATASGIVNTGRDLEAADTEYFLVANNDSIDIVTDFSFFAWMNPESTATQCFAEKGPYTNCLFSMYCPNGAGKNEFYVKAGGGGAGTIVIPTGAWAYAGGLWNGAQIISYVNAVADKTTAYTTAPTDTTSPLKFGRDIAGTYTSWDGVMDEVVLAKRYFRAEEIKSLYCKGLNGLTVISEPSPAPTASSVSTRRVFMIT